jgi:hypothetical protein
MTPIPLCGELFLLRNRKISAFFFFFCYFFNKSRPVTVTLLPIGLSLSLLCSLLSKVFSTSKSGVSGHLPTLDDERTSPASYVLLVVRQIGYKPTLKLCDQSSQINLAISRAVIKY